MPIVAVILMLVAPRARVNAPALLVGWVLGLAIVGAIVLFVADQANASSDGKSATWVDVLELVLGALLVLVALKQWRERPHGDEEPATPKWMRAIDSFTPPKALGAGALLAGANPKNLAASAPGATRASSERCRRPSGGRYPRGGISGRRADRTVGDVGRPDAAFVAGTPDLRRRATRS